MRRPSPGPRTLRSIVVTLLSYALTGCAHYEIVGYYAAWKPATEFAPREVTVVNYAFVDICWDGEHGHPVEGGLKPCLDSSGAPAKLPNGSIVLDDPAHERAALARLADARHANPALKLMASVGGWTRSNRFSDMASDAAARGAFTRSAVELLRSHRLDGIDIDWEYPGEIGVPCAPAHTCQRLDDKRNFVLLANELRSAFDAAGAADGKRYLVTIAAGADEKFLRDADANNTWLVELARSLDWINVMTYDYHGSWERAAGLNAPLARDPHDQSNANVEASLTRLLESGIPARKITLGMPFYGKGWSGCAPGSHHGLYQPCTGLAAGSSEETFDFAYLTEKGYLARDENGEYTRAGLGFTRHWNPYARVPYLYNAATGDFITYDDERSIREKAALVKRLGLRGAMFWELGADRHGVLRGTVSHALSP